MIGKWLKRGFQYFGIACFSVIAAMTLASGYYIYYDDPSCTSYVRSIDPLSCPFCSERVLDKQQVMQGEHVRVLYNYQPQLQGHCLVTSKEHLTRFEEWSEETVHDFHLTVKKMSLAFKAVYGTDDFVLLMQNGFKSGQTQYHSHFHMIPRKERDVIIKLKLWYNTLSLFMGVRSPLDREEMQKLIVPLQNALKEVEL